MILIKIKLERIFNDTFFKLNNKNNNNQNEQIIQIKFKVNSNDETI